MFSSASERSPLTKANAQREADGDQEDEREELYEAVHHSPLFPSVSRTSSLEWTPTWPSDFSPTDGTILPAIGRAAARMGILGIINSL
jgi:hypothetical protein